MGLSKNRYIVGIVSSCAWKTVYIRVKESEVYDIREGTELLETSVSVLEVTVMVRKGWGVHGTSPMRFLGSRIPSRSLPVLRCHSRMVC